MTRQTWKVLAVLCAACGLASSAQAQNFGLQLLGQWSREGLPVVDYQSYNDIWAWHDGMGREYAIVGSLDSIYFIEVTNPNQPVLRDVEAGRSAQAIHRDFKTYGHYCYAVADEGPASLQVFDLSFLPDSVHKVYDADKLAQRVHNIYIDGERLYLGTCRLRNGNLVPMRILSIANPVNPKLLLDVYGPELGGSYLFKEVHDMFVRHDTIYASTGNDGLFAMQYHDSMTYSNPDSAWTVWEPNYTMLTWGAVVNYPFRGYNHSSWMGSGSNLLAMADETHGMKLKLIRFSWNDIPEVLSTFGSRHDEGSIPHNPFIHKRQVFVSYYHEGLLVFNISNPGQPRLVAQWDTYPENKDFKGMYGCWGVYPYLPSGYVVASDQVHGLLVFDKSIGIEEDAREDMGLEVYPNPANDWVQVRWRAPGHSADAPVELHALDGRVLYRGSIRANQTLEICTKSLGPGYYLAHVVGPQGRIVRRIAIK
ncbi:MAG: choice-of-anchor B family protein [Bacteroidetes bacterium]|nr:choice-of-anchor B family protein [Bacteroidota bacterium]